MHIYYSDIDKDLTSKRALTMGKNNELKPDQFGSFPAIEWFFMANENRAKNLKY